MKRFPRPWGRVCNPVPAVWAEGNGMKGQESVYLPHFTIGLNAFDAFRDVIGRYGNKIAAVHGEKPGMPPAVCYTGCGKKPA